MLQRIIPQRLQDVYHFNKLIRLYFNVISIETLVADLPDAGHVIQNADLFKMDVDRFVEYFLVDILNGLWPVSHVLATVIQFQRTAFQILTQGDVRTIRRFFGPSSLWHTIQEGTVVDGAYIEPQLTIHWDFIATDVPLVVRPAEYPIPLRKALERTFRLRGGHIARKRIRLE